MKFSISLPTGFEGVMYPIPFVDPADFVRLAKLCELRDISRDLEKNVKRSWTMILVPNIACIAAASKPSSALR